MSSLASIPSGFRDALRWQPMKRYLVFSHRILAMIEPLFAISPFMSPKDSSQRASTTNGARVQITSTKPPIYRYAMLYYGSASVM